MSINKYTYLFVFFVILIVTLLSSINYAVDPYMLYQSKRIEGFNDKKPSAANRSALYKPYNVVSIRPQTIIVGNSRPEMGIDPESICWPPESDIVYSLTFPGLSLYGQVRALFHAVSVSESQLHTILLGVDFSDFLHKKRPIKKSFWPKNNSKFFDRLLVDEQLRENKGYSLNKLKDFSISLFSLTALNDSVTTLISQTPNSSTRTQLGYNPAKDYHQIIYYEGAWVLFEQKEKELKKRFNKRELSVYDLDQWSVELEAIKRVVQLAVNQNIELTLFINPYHYIYLESIRNAGYWNEFENFKKSLKYTVDHYGKNKVLLWDFALYSDYTVSTVPKKNAATQSFQWFWEPAHYKTELGELILADIFGQSCIKEKKLPVGIRLNDVNIGTHLLKQKKQRTILLQELHSPSTSLNTSSL